MRHIDTRYTRLFAAILRQALQDDCDEVNHTISFTLRAGQMSNSTIYTFLKNHKDAIVREVKSAILEEYIKYPYTTISESKRAVAAIANKYIDICRKGVYMKTVPVKTKDFLKAFFKDDENVNFRTFNDKGGGAGKNYTIKLSDFDKFLPELKKDNDSQRGVYFIVNAGGHTDKEITRITAQFYECDHISLEAQYKQAMEFALEPSIIVRTEKSLHIYFLMKDAAVEKFRDIQSRLTHRFNGDKACVNESRVFRVPGFYHHKHDPLLVECLKFDPHLVYTQEQLAQYLPQERVVEKKQKEKVEEANYSGRGIEIACHKCLFLNHCRENPAKLSEHDWYAMITNLVVFDDGIERIHEYSQPYPSYSEKETNVKIEHAQESETGPIFCETIADKGWRCPNLGKCACNSPAGMAYTKLTVEDLKYFLEKIEPTLSASEDYAAITAFIDNHFLNVKSDIAELFIEDKIKAHFKLKAPTIKKIKEHYHNLIRQTKDYDCTVDLEDTLEDVCKHIESFYKKPGERARALIDSVCKWFLHHDAKFFSYLDGTVLVCYKGKIYRIADEIFFTGFLSALTKMPSITYEGRAILKGLQEYAAIYGRCMRQAKVTHYHKNAVYMNLCNDRDDILKISPSSAVVIRNGLNDDDILLASPVMPIDPIEFNPDVDIKKGLGLFKEYVVDVLTVSDNDRLFLACMFIGIFLKDMCSSKPIIRLSGSSNSGKSTAVKIFTALLFGRELALIPTAAMFSTAAAKDPLVCLDNVETSNLTQDIKNILLVAATGGTKGKREINTNQGVIAETYEALIMVTGIEPFTLGEIINRCFEMLCSEERKSKGFIEHDHIDKMLAHRSEILSAIFMFIAKHVLPTITAVREEAMQRLNMGENSKGRMNEYFSLVMTILKALVEVLPEINYKNLSLGEIVADWLNTQNDTATDTEAGTDPIVFLMERLLKELQKEQGVNLSDNYTLQLRKTEGGAIIGWRCSMTDLLSAFKLLVKNKGYECPFKTAKELSKRVENSRKVLEKEGWKISKDKLYNGRQTYIFENLSYADEEGGE